MLLHPLSIVYSAPVNHTNPATITKTSSTRQISGKPSGCICHANHPHSIHLKRMYLRRISRVKTPIAGKMSKDTIRWNKRSRELRVRVGCVNDCSFEQSDLQEIHTAQWLGLRSRGRGQEDLQRQRYFSDCIVFAFRNSRTAVVSASPTHQLKVSCKS